MDLPPLAPDLSFHRLGDGPDDMAFAYQAKRAAMEPHVTKRWAWDDAFQRDLHERNFHEKSFYQIRRSTLPLGTLALDHNADHLRLGEFYLFPAHQRHGTGTAILAHCLAVADDLGLPVRLEHLIWNPVGSLYRRHGFRETRRSDTHVFLIREAVGPRAD